MKALEHPDSLSVEDYLAGEEVSGVVVEVLSESTRRVDANEKRDAYFTGPSLKALILVESDRPEVIVYRRVAEGGFAMERYSGLEASIALDEIDAALPLAELYQRAGFDA